MGAFWPSQAQSATSWSLGSPDQDRATRDSRIGSRLSFCRGAMPLRDVLFASHFQRPLGALILTRQCRTRWPRVATGKCWGRFASAMERFLTLPHTAHRASACLTEALLTQSRTGSRGAELRVRATGFDSVPRLCYRYAAISCANTTHCPMGGEESAQIEAHF